MKQVQAIQGDTVDLICWRYYGRTQGITEQVLSANPQLAKQDVILPIGTVVNLPDIAMPQQNKQSINLWD